MKYLLIVFLSCVFLPKYSLGSNPKMPNTTFDSTKKNRAVQLFVGLKFGMPYFLETEESILNSHAYLSRNELNYEGSTGYTKGLIAETYFAKPKFGIEFNFTYTNTKYYVIIQRTNNLGLPFKNPDIHKSEYFDRVLYLNKLIWSRSGKTSIGASIGYYSIAEWWSGKTIKTTASFNLGKKNKIKINLIIEKRWPNEIKHIVRGATLIRSFQYPLYGFITVSYKLF